MKSLASFYGKRKPLAGVGFLAELRKFRASTDKKDVPRFVQVENLSHHVATGALTALLGALVFVYLSGFSFYDWWSAETTVRTEKIGTVRSVFGMLRCQHKDLLEFAPVRKGADLYDEDILMTGSSDRARIEVFGQSNVDLEPSSLVRLSLEPALGENSIGRRVLVDVLAGDVKGDFSNPRAVLRRSAEPSRPSNVALSRPVTPIPSSPPLALSVPVAERAIFDPPKKKISLEALRFVLPAPGQILTLGAGVLPPLRQNVVFQAPSGARAEVLLLLRNAVGREIVRTKVTTGIDGRGFYAATFERPGRYLLELRDPSGKKIASGLQAAFTVAPDFKGIETQAPLLGDHPEAGRQPAEFVAKDGILLRWKAIPGTTQYRVRIASRQGKPLTERTMRANRMLASRKSIRAPSFAYTVRAELSSGYIATSESEVVELGTDSPKLSSPLNGATVSLASPAVAERGGVIFTWEPSTSGDGYEFEISANSQFSRILTTLQTRENYLLMRGLKPAKYWWRVRLTTTDKKSAAGAAFKLLVTR